MSIATRMAGIDPKYGQQLHQRAFIERMEGAQLKHPCAKQHEHVTACYPKDRAGHMVFR